MKRVASHFSQHHNIMQKYDYFGMEIFQTRKPIMTVRTRQKVTTLADESCTHIQSSGLSLQQTTINYTIISQNNKALVASPQKRACSIMNTSLIFKYLINFLTPSTPGRDNGNELPCNCHPYIANKDVHWTPKLFQSTVTQSEQRTEYYKAQKREKNMSLQKEQMTGFWWDQTVVKTTRT